MKLGWQSREGTVEMEVSDIAEYRRTRVVS